MSTNFGPKCRGRFITITIWSWLKNPRRIVLSKKRWFLTERSWSIYNEKDFHFSLHKNRKEIILSNISETWLLALQNNGYRLTESRRTVVNIIAESNHALTPMNVFDLARRQHSKLGLVTVYRTLEKLEELKLIQRVHQPEGCQAFISAFTGHQHMILCSICGRIDFFNGENLEAFFTSIGETTGFLVKDHWLQLFGICSDCRKKIGKD